MVVVLMIVLQKKNVIKQLVFLQMLLHMKQLYTLICTQHHLHQQKSFLSLLCFLTQNIFHDLLLFHFRVFLHLLMLFHFLISFLGLLPSQNPLSSLCLIIFQILLNFQLQLFFLILKYFH